MKIFVHSVPIFLLLSIVNGFTYASCTAASFGDYSYSITNTTLTVAPDTPLGPIGDVIDVGNGPQTWVNCNGIVYNYLKFSFNPVNSGVASVYETNIPGIGVKVWDTYVGNVVLGEKEVLWYNTSSPYSGTAWLTQLHFQFYVTGPVTPGEIILPTPFVEVWANTSSTSLSGGAIYNRVTIPNHIVVKVATCETPNVLVNMGNHTSSEFNGVGSHLEGIKFDFNINNCLEGLTSVSYTFQPAAGIKLNGINNEQYLGLSSSSTAKGVGVQVLDAKGDLVRFNEKLDLTNFKGAGSYSLEMSARYIQTDEISGGIANSAMEVLMNYK